MSGDHDRPASADVAAAEEARGRPHWLGRTCWAVLAAAVLVGVLAATIGWDTTASATVDQQCGQWVSARGQLLYRAGVTKPGVTIGAAQAASLPSFEISAGAVRLPSGAIRLPVTMEYPRFPAGHLVRVHHRLFRSDTYTFLADDGTRVPLLPPTHMFDRVACTGS